MTYHLSRVMHWIQNRSVADYPTHILRQLHQNPWSEFAILHFQLLSGGDHFANLIQWFAMIGCTLGVSLLAKEFGADSRGQIFAAVFGVTLPMGILQGSSTQNDYVLAFWLVCFTYHAYLLKKDNSLQNSVITGASLGLAILTKGTAYIFALPMMAWVGWSIIRSQPKKGCIALVTILTISFLINIGHYSRNYELYGNPLGPGQEENTYTYSNDIITFSSVTSNMIRNAALHMGTSDVMNNVLENWIYQVHSMIGIDPNDPRTTWPKTEFHILPPSLNEDVAGNPLHLFLILICAGSLLVQHRKNDVTYYSICLMLAFILFCAYLRWQPWHSRLHLPLFILWSPIVGISLAQIQMARYANTLVLILLVGSLPWLLANSTRPLIGGNSIMVSDRTGLYFIGRPLIYQPYIDSVLFLKESDCSEIGIMLDENDWEYPFWVLLENNGRDFQLEHVNVDNVSQIKNSDHSFGTFKPCAVVMVNDDPPKAVLVKGVIFIQEFSSRPISIFLPK